MRNSIKVARWEIKRNLKNRSFIISMLITPLIMALFMAVPMVMSMLEGDPEPLTLYVRDELGVWTDEQSTLLEERGEWEVVLNPSDERAVLSALRQAGDAVYVVLTEAVVEEGRIPVYASEGVDRPAVEQLRFLDEALDLRRLEKAGVAREEAQKLLAGVEFELIPVAGEGGEPSPDGAAASSRNPMERLVPAGFAGAILFSVVITGMMTFQSASEEKKEKISELILSSVTPSELMQGKILGYFVLGLLQVLFWLAVAIPIVLWRYDPAILRFLLVPELVPLLYYAVAGYLLFAALFVAMGATVEDMTRSSNFQGLVFIIPWLPFMLLGPILSDPEGTVALVGSYFPLTAPGVMLVRLARLDEWPWLQIGVSSIILAVSIWLLMKLAGKIFKTGILLYGKNATPKEIWRWLRY